MIARPDPRSRRAANPVPQSISMAQTRVALRQAGLLNAVEAAIASGDAATGDAWEYSSELRRDSELVATLGTSLGLSPERIDALFIAAAGIEF